MIIPMRRNRGGTARSSDEAPVMGVEPRGCVIQFCEIVNQTEDCDQPEMGGITLEQNGRN